MDLRTRDRRAFTSPRSWSPTHRHELHVHCYRMLGSLDDADEALQETTMVAAWRGLPGFEGRSSLPSWLYRIATHCTLRLARRRPSRRSPATTRSTAPSGSAPSNVLTLRDGRVSWIASFLDRAVLARLGLPAGL